MDKIDDLMLERIQKCALATMLQLTGEKLHTELQLKNFNKISSSHRRIAQASWHGLTFEQL